MNFCPNCGSRIDPEASFCGSCGSAIGENASLTPTGQGTSPAAAASPANAGSAVWIAIICSIVALAFLPPIFGGIAIWQALKVKKSQPDTGNVLLAVAIVCTAVGMVVGALIWL